MTEQTEPQTFTCPRRIADGMDKDDSPFQFAGSNIDTYQTRRGLVRQKEGCSYCGSMPPEAFMQAVRDGAIIEPTDKSYKFYLSVDDRHSKFYTHHLSVEQGDEFIALWRESAIVWGPPGYPYVELYIPHTLDQADV